MQQSPLPCSPWGGGREVEVGGRYDYCDFSLLLGASAAKEATANLLLLLLQRGATLQRSPKGWGGERGGGGGRAAALLSSLSLVHSLWRTDPRATGGLDLQQFLLRSPPSPPLVHLSRISPRERERLQSARRTYTHARRHGEYIAP